MKLKSKVHSTSLLDEPFSFLEIGVEIHFLEKFIQTLHGKLLFASRI